MWHDPIVEEVRAIRDEYARQFGYDLRMIGRDLKEREQAAGRRVVRLSPRPVVQKPQPKQPVHTGG
jgi:hypothetical protein